MTPDCGCGTLCGGRPSNALAVLPVCDYGRKLSRFRRDGTLNLRLHFPARGALPSIGAFDYAQEANP